MALFRTHAPTAVTKSLGAPRSAAAPVMKGPAQGAPIAPLLSPGERKLQAAATLGGALPAPKFKDRDEYRDYISSGGTRLPVQPAPVVGRIGAAGPLGATPLPSKVSKGATPPAAPLMKGPPQAGPLAPMAPGAPVSGRVGANTALPPPGEVGPLAPPTPPALKGYAQAAPGDPLGAASANKYPAIAATADPRRKVGKVIAPLPPPQQKFKDREHWRDYAFSGGTRGAPVSAPAGPLSAMKSVGAPTGVAKAVASLTPPALKGYAHAGPGAMLGKIEKMLAPRPQPRFKNRDHYRDWISSGGSRG